MIRQRKSGELLRQTAVHPLGRLTLAGLLINHRATAPMPMRFWDTFALVYVLQGHATFHDETGLCLPLRAGDLLLMFPGHGYHYDVDPRSSWSEFALHFQGPIFDLWRQNKVLDPAHPIYHVMPIDRWLKRFEDLVRSSPRRKADQMLKQICELQQLLECVLTDGHGPKQEHPHNLWLAEATALLDTTPIAKPFNWHVIASKMGLSYDRFRKKFVEFSGTSPTKYLMARRLEAACKLLEDRKLGLKQIAKECGFCDAFQFSKQFKQRMRLTPTEYREFKLHTTTSLKNGKPIHPV